MAGAALWHGSRSSLRRLDTEAQHHLCMGNQHLLALCAEWALRGMLPSRSACCLSGLAQQLVAWCLDTCGCHSAFTGKLPVSALWSQWSSSSKLPAALHSLIEPSLANTCSLPAQAGRAAGIMMLKRDLRAAAPAQAGCLCSPCVALERLAGSRPAKLDAPDNMHPLTDVQLTPCGLQVPHWQRPCIASTCICRHSR